MTVGAVTFTLNMATSHTHAHTPDRGGTLTILHSS